MCALGHLGHSSYAITANTRPRVVPFGAKTAQAVDRYLRVRALHPYAGPRYCCSVSAAR
ncbi:hypothetical protein [Geodermatophilus sabuli]|uniref:Uncharacterized protein n=1 Tax=Geodermatophilus sabuli TaxID=1564158 RepID=A0A285EEF8_9ACTN|nr:hypothetical protein [Geodermatophilus sabuli]MBB3084562.1 site-specific recombinase XerD [Geodermatophilus sabuli]SNX97243.1 hypothetical protein SAMN06893097_106193 [Geodermatophilus sabuli]